MTETIYRKEREQMPSGSRTQTFRVIVKLANGKWGTVQSGLAEVDADNLLAHIRRLEVSKGA